MMTTPEPDTAPEMTVPTTPRETWRGRVREEITQGRAAAWLGWRVVRRHPTLLLWRVIGAGLGKMLFAILWAMIFGVVLLHVGLLEKNTPLDDVFTSLIALCTSPSFIVGALGCVACVSAISWFADATSEAGVWEACARELEAPSPRTSPWAMAPKHIPHVMMWQLFKGVLGLAGALLFAGVYIGLIKMQALELHAVFKALGLALLYGAGLLYAGLWLGLTSWYPAMAIAHPSLHPGERLLLAAQRALNSPVALYRLFLHAILPVVPLWVISALLSLGKWLTIQDPELNSVLSVMGLLIDLLTFVGVVAAGVAWRAGSSYLEASWSGRGEQPDELVAQFERRRALGKSSAHSTFVHMGAPHPQHPEILDVEIDHLRPRQTPHVFALSSMLDASHKVPVREDE